SYRWRHAGGSTVLLAELSCLAGPAQVSATPPMSWRFLAARVRRPEMFGVCDRAGSKARRVRRLHASQEVSQMRRHLENHRTGKAGWLRAAVLGADDGILSTASLM